jgi:uncharacterized damage-inducible protein DinB
MLTPEQARTLCDYNAWANRRILDACTALSPEEFTRDLRSSFRSVQGTLLHIIGGEWFWLERWRGPAWTAEEIEKLMAGEWFLLERWQNRPARARKMDQTPDFADLRGLAEETDAELREFVAGLSGDDLARVFNYPTTEGNPNSQPYWQMIQHVVNHSTQYRGQVTTLLRQSGKTPVATDLILYYREKSGKPPGEPPTPETIRLSYDYNAWANRRLLEACAQLSEEQFTRDLRSSFPSVRDTLFHILGAEWLWLERWQGRSPAALPSPEPCRSLGDISRKWAELDAHLRRFVAGRAPQELARIHEFRTTKGVVYPSALWQALQHVVNHGTYHRGQAAAMLRQLGARPNFTDLIYFYRERTGQALD